MSRSYRKTPVFGNVGCHSEKDDKRIGNRKLRRINKSILKNDEGECIYKIMDEAMNVWSMGKDGKHYWPEKEKSSYMVNKYWTQEEWIEDRLRRWKEAMRK